MYPNFRVAWSTLVAWLRWIVPVTEAAEHLPIRLQQGRHILSKLKV
jgi:hypothetical protein